MKQQELILMQLENHTNLLTDKHTYEKQQLIDKIGFLELQAEAKRNQFDEMRNSMQDRIN